MSTATAADQRQPHDNALGHYLRDRRQRIDPASLGLPAGRRRTPGLRREEVAQRAAVSATWYTWLEQGRGGAPSPEALERIAQALLLDQVERQHLFMLAQGRPPEVRYLADNEVSSRLQRVLDAFGTSPALVRSVTWDVLAWNRAACAVLADYPALAPHERNILRLIFSADRPCDEQPEWEAVARMVVSTFRADAVRAGASRHVQGLVDELCHSSPDFARLWREQEVSVYGEGSKCIQRPGVGMLHLEYSTFAVDGRPEQRLLVFTPMAPADTRGVLTLMAAYDAAHRH
ncbi:helix-turn-helix transcriptional regulator [Herbaspirillum robiniae]|uniref:Transcriptional regulator n=1 Tax=Herbaspirillum robiniae TaxID=2014887 RepID=A0A246WKZ6_9BURK|nr:helix-turn-helix transcriptional regulator [Herbaspirillum robiniae]OWY26988.1 transcriptional regulator [Herbaspirillum robiniae]